MRAAARSRALKIELFGIPATVEHGRLDTQQGRGGVEPLRGWRFASRLSRLDGLLGDAQFGGKSHRAVVCVDAGLSERGGVEPRVAHHVLSQSTHSGAF